jgi:hypothetical protein
MDAVEGEFGIEYEYALAIFEGSKSYEGRGYSAKDGRRSRLVDVVLPMLGANKTPRIKVLIEQPVPGAPHPRPKRVVGWYYALVTGYHHYPNCREMLEAEGVSAMLPGVTDLGAGCRVYAQWSDPAREFWALRILPDSPTICWETVQP